MYYQLRGALGLALVLSGCSNEYKFDDSAGPPSSDCYRQGIAQSQNVRDEDTATPWFDDYWETCDVGE